MSEVKNIKGVLSIEDKIWFNDEYGCRLRIGGFTKKQIKKLENLGMIDITIINENSNGSFKAAIQIIPEEK